MIPGFVIRWLAPAPDSDAAGNIRRGRSPWAESIHLLWSAWVFITPLFNGGFRGYTLTWLIFTLATYPVFLMLFFGMQVTARRYAAWFPLGMLILNFAVMRWYPSGLSYLIYGCVMLLHLRMSRRRYLVALALINLAFVAYGRWLGYPSVMLVIIPGMIFIVCVSIFVEHLGRQRDAALALSHEEVRRLAATAERERIGRDLHDLLGHTLSLITLKLELSRKLFDRDIEAARREVTDAEQVARKALAEVRAAVTGIRATDIAVELAEAKLLLESASVHLEYDAPPPLPTEVARALALILREAATNISRHADASTARIGFQGVPGGVQMCIADNGRGGIVTDGNGLRGIRERVSTVGGQLDIDSPRGGGTRLSLRVPFATPARDDVARATTTSAAPNEPAAGRLTDPLLAGDRA